MLVCIVCIETSGCLVSGVSPNFKCPNCPSFVWTQVLRTEMDVVCCFFIFHASFTDTEAFHESCVWSKRKTDWKSNGEENIGLGSVCNHRSEYFELIFLFCHVMIL